MSSIRTADTERGMRSLRKISKKVKKYGTQDLRNIIQLMLWQASEFEKDNPSKLCAGLAAPQVGVNQRVIIVRNSNTREHQEWTVMVNPVYVESRGDFQREDEECLSVPKLRGEVVRPGECVFFYFTEQGKRVPHEGYLQVSGESARVLCHELDHLNGVLFCDNAVNLYREDIINPVIPDPAPQTHETIFQDMYSCKCGIEMCCGERGCCHPFEDDEIDFFCKNCLTEDRSQCTCFEGDDD